MVEQLTFPLQILASKTASFLLATAGVSAVREGNIILLPSARLEVAEACSGVRSLFSLITLTVIYGYITETRIGVRVLLALIAIPTSILANALRIAVTGVAVEYWGVESCAGNAAPVFRMAHLRGIALRYFPFSPHGADLASERAATRETGGVRVISRNARFALVVLLLAGTALLLHARSGGSFVPQRFPLASFPIELSSWVGTDIPIPDEILKKLGPGEFLQRTYQDRTKEDQAGGQSNVDLYIAYLPNQTVLYRHLPQECLAGAGWLPVESGITNLAFSGDAPFPVNRYLIAKGSDRQLVLFWYSAHGRRVASEDSMEWHLMFDSLRSNRSDNALIRLNTELRPGENPAEAEQRLLSFASLVNPLLKNYIPR